MFAAVVFSIGVILLCVFGETLPRDDVQLNNIDIGKKAPFDELGVEEPDDIDPAATREAFIDGNTPFPFADGRKVPAPTSGMLENARLVFNKVSTEILASDRLITFSNKLHFEQ